MWPNKAQFPFGRNKLTMCSCLSQQKVYQSQADVEQWSEARQGNDNNDESHEKSEEDEWR